MSLQVSLRALAVVSIVSVGLAIASKASAQDVAPYFVVTNDGSTYQGQLVENVVGQHVTLRLVSGDIRTFAANDVRLQGTVGAVFPSVPPALPSIFTTLPTAPPVAYGGPDAVKVHITKANNGEGRLFMEGASGWESVCTMPCTTSVDPKISYRVHDSEPFRFPTGHPIDVVADTERGTVFHAFGWASIGLAFAATPFGIATAAGAFSGGVTPRTPIEVQHEQQVQNSNLAIGGAVLGVSAALLTLGIVLCAIHPSTTLTTTEGQRLVKVTPRGLVF